jgi:tetratricopeptide (TPR) repeat protein
MGTGFVATAIIAAAVPMWSVRRTLDNSSSFIEKQAKAEFVGMAVCRECHEAEYKKWSGSDHDDAMDVADETTVLGDFNNAVYTAKGVTSKFFRKGERYMVNTEGPTGKLEDFEIEYTFGVEPIQQYLIAFPGGRLQALNIAWDTDTNSWFAMYPDQTIPAGDWLHWTRNGQNWNGMCAECHSTNLQKNYDPKTDTYNTIWSEINVSCEACHGPGSQHAAWAKIPPMARPPIDNFGLTVNTHNMTAKEQVELCAPCHSRHTEIADYDHRQKELLDFQIPILLDETVYYADGQILDEDYEWGSFTQSKMFARGVKCSDCHDPHSLLHPLTGNALCLRCHPADAYDTKNHHFHDKLNRGRPSDGVRCIKCHMPERTYMVIDERADHSIRIPRPDLSRSIETPNACNQQGCHANESVDWSAAAFTKWYGKALKPHYGTALAAGRRQDTAAEPELIRMSQDPLIPATVRATALSLLGQYPTEKSLAAFEKSVADEDGLVRLTAVREIPESDPARLVEVLTSLLFDPLKAVRTEAANRLADAPKALLKPYQQEALQKDIDEYIAELNHSLDFAASNHSLGNLYSRMNQPVEAEKYYRRAVSVDDLFYPSKVNLSVILSASGRNDEAEKLLTEVVKAYPEQYDAHYLLGLLLAELGKYQEARDHLAIAAAGMPDHEGAKRNLRAVKEYLEKVQ